MKRLWILLPLLFAAACGRDVATVSGPPGPAGAAGAPGPATSASPLPNDIIEEIYPCNHTGTNAEILYRMANGKVMGSFTNSAGQTSLTEFSPGTYVTTDGQKCKFTVHADGSVSW